MSITEDQAPTLTEAQAGRIERHARGIAQLGWLMAAAVPDLPRLEDLLRRPPWTAQGACRGDSAPFFVERGGDPRLSRAVRVPLLRDGRSRFAGFLERHERAGAPIVAGPGSRIAFQPPKRSLLALSTTR